MAKDFSSSIDKTTNAINDVGDPKTSVVSLTPTDIDRIAKLRNANTTDNRFANIDKVSMLDQKTGNYLLNVSTDTAANTGIISDGVVKTNDYLNALQSSMSFLVANLNDIGAGSSTTLAKNELDRVVSSLIVKASSAGTANVTDIINGVGTPKAGMDNGLTPMDIERIRSFRDINMANSRFANIDQVGGIDTKTGKYLLDVSKNTDKVPGKIDTTNDYLNVLQSSVNLLAANLAVMMAGNNPALAKQASIGSSVGGLAGAALGVSMGKLGTAIMPGIGSLIGAGLGMLLGSAFGAGKGEAGRKPTPEPLVANTDALRENTDAVKSLDVQLQDLRSELINAPSKFNIPQMGLGFRSGGVSIQINAGSGLSANAAKSMAQDVSKAVDKAYKMQGRTNSNNTRLFTR
jgi:hypothetical protein